MPFFSSISSFPRLFYALLLYRGSLTMGYQIFAVAAGWHVYEITHDPLSLGLIGLAEILPYFASVLFVGHAVDVFSKKTVASIGIFIHLLLACWMLAFSLGWLDHINLEPQWFVYIAVGFAGFARSFIQPTYQSLFSQILKREQYAKGAAVGAVIFQTALILGPALGGILIGWKGLTLAYSATLLLTMLSLVAIYLLKSVASTRAASQTDSVLTSIGQGVRFVLKQPILLSAMSLDMLAVLLGGSVSMLPAFIHEILNGSPENLGLLRAAPAIGSVLVGIILAKKTINCHTGKYLLASVAGFGLSIIAFGLATHLWIAFFCLALSGLFDGTSMVLRSSIFQLTTPPHLQGRVSSISGIFIGSSNEIGAFESGLTASWFGLIPSIILGGTLTILVVIIFYFKAPSLRDFHLNHLVEKSNV